MDKTFKAPEILNPTSGLRAVDMELSIEFWQNS